MINDIVHELVTHDLRLCGLTQFRCSVKHRELLLSAGLAVYYGLVGRHVTEFVRGVGVASGNTTMI